MLIREATHAGSWYSNDRATIASQISALFARAPTLKKGARVLLGPHAGYTYCGQRLAETYNVWDCKSAERVFILGPSHHVYFRDHVQVSSFSSYDTPLGKVPVDTEITEELLQDALFEYMSEEADEEEHLFEMHLPFLVARCHAEKRPAPKIIPIMISGLSKKTRSAVVDALLPYFADEANTFVILSDFCHWGRRFGYTEYIPDMELLLICAYKNAADTKTPIFKLIEYLDRSAMLVAGAGSVAKWDSYIETTGNTICGQKPVAVVLLLLERFRASGGELASDEAFQWLGYSQSSKVSSLSDSSVSYASGYVLLK